MTVEIIHVFEETSKEAMRAHMKHWFGRPYNEDYVGEDGSYMVCHCGGILVPVEKDDGDVSVGAVWHQRDIRELADDE